MKLPFILAGAVLATASLQVFAQTSTTTPADNSKTNKTESHQVVSADAQKNDSGDLSLTRLIRQKVIADKTLSTYAHNVKIVAVGGTVTLNGPVRSEAEKEFGSSYGCRDRGTGSCSQSNNGGCAEIVRHLRPETSCASRALRYASPFSSCKSSIKLTPSSIALTILPRVAGVKYISANDNHYCRS